VLNLFGKETRCSVASPANFVDLADRMARLLEQAWCRVSARGTIQAAKAKNVAPRRGFWTPGLRDKFVESLDMGDLLGVEFFDSRWSDARPPDAFGSIHKYWGYGPGGKTERTEVGAENNLTIALREDLVASAFEMLKAASHELLEKIDGFYGTIESGVPWGQEDDDVYDDVVDVRWHYRGHNDYFNGIYQMEKMVPRLDRGNILCRTQFVNHDLQGLRELRGVAAVEPWPRGLTYLELARQPKYGTKPSPRFADFIRFVPEDAADD
jgi:hypothetical protein